MELKFPTPDEFYPIYNKDKTNARTKLKALYDSAPFIQESLGMYRSFVGMKPEARFDELWRMIDEAKGDIDVMYRIAFPEQFAA
jgi:hypothetical protein